MFCTLRVPAEEGRKLCLQEVKPEFTSKIDGLRLTLAGVLREPHAFGSSAVTGGPMLNILLRKICDTMKTRETLYPMR